MRVWSCYLACLQNHIGPRSGMILILYETNYLHTFRDNYSSLSPYTSQGRMVQPLRARLHPNHTLQKNRNSFPSSRQDHLETLRIKYFAPAMYNNYKCHLVVVGAQSATHFTVFISQISGHNLLNRLLILHQEMAYITIFNAMKMKMW